MRELQKYAVNNEEILKDIENRLTENKYSLTAFSLKEILKTRLKRGDENALENFKNYLKAKMQITGRFEQIKMSDPVKAENLESFLKDSLNTLFEEFHKKTDKEKDNDKSFELFESQYTNKLLEKNQ